MKANFLLVLIYFSCFNVHGQDHDNTWIFGYDGGSQSLNDTTYGLSIVRFDLGNVTVQNNQIGEMNFRHTDVSMSNDDGLLLFYYNGIYIEDASYKTMENGCCLNDPENYDFNIPQGGVVLPYPNTENKYVLLHETKGWIDGWGVEGVGLYYSVIDMEGNGGWGEVVLKKQPLIIDTLENGKVTAVKHANGRDWWIMINESHSNLYYEILLDPNGVQLMGTQEIGANVTPGLGQAVFSPDGTKLVKRNGINHEVGDFLDIYDFNRCTGEFSNHLQINYFDGSSAGGAAISPNSRFLYVPSTFYLYQYDLWADDIRASKDTVAIYDGFGDPFSTLFYQAQLAPNGKIYISNSNSSNYLHIIHSPNKKGLACNVEQHGFHLPTRNAFSMPNFPNYRLGPLDGSPCDTLGLDNHPIAKYRYEQDTLDYLQIEFTDLSYYEPAEWHWDFGDNTTSQDTSPVHTFMEDGTYEVCLTVGNINSENTFCRTLGLGTVTSAEEAAKVDITVFPNPCREGVNIILGGYLPKAGKVVLYDAVGQRQKVQPLQTGWNTLRLDGLRAGVYFYEIWENGVLLRGGKLVKVE